MIIESSPDGNMSTALKEIHVHFEGIKAWYHCIKNFDDPEYKKLMQSMPASFINEVSCYKKKEDQLRKISGRLLLLKALESTGHSRGKVHEIKKSKYNKPYLPGWWNFNVSHSGNLVVLVFSESCRVGVDVEYCKETDYRNLLSVFHPNELQQIENSKSSQQIFYEMWVRKEAVLKALGCGLVDGLEGIDASGDQVVLSSENWYLKELALAESYCCCLAYDECQKKIDIEQKEFW